MVKRRASETVQKSLLDTAVSFASFSDQLDDRLLKAVADLKFAHPTLVQAKAIPLALQGRDILARAKTGSGKTAAYLLPVLQNILRVKAGSSKLTEDNVRGLVLVPTRELSEQVTLHCEALAKYCRKEIKVFNLASGSTSDQVQRSTLGESKPDVIIATPARILKALDHTSLSLKCLQSLVVDEADLILSYGYEDDMKRLLGSEQTSYLPTSHQTYLMSATLTEDIKTLKALALRNPATLTLEEDENDSERLVQYLIRTTEEDKFLLLFVILKLKLIQGKCLIFANDVDRSYRIKLFLERFGIRSCVLNSELPINSRYHIVEEFNRGVYQYIIATDESAVKPASDTHQDPRANEPAKKRKVNGKGKSGQRAQEFGVSRGIDFVNVSCVINFDLPADPTIYTHRIGRTARAEQTGTALSFAVMQEAYRKGLARAKAHHLHCATTEHDENTVRAIVAEQSQDDRPVALQDYAFDMDQADGFRYRVDDALRSVTRSAIHEARLKEVKEELINSAKLKAHFEDNPKDLAFLRHDKALHPTRIDSHLKHVPAYLMPRIANLARSHGLSEQGSEGADESGSRPQFVPFNKLKSKKGRHGNFMKKSRKADPLKKFTKKA